MSPQKPQAEKRKNQEDLKENPAPIKKIKMSEEINSQDDEEQAKKELGKGCSICLEEMDNLCVLESCCHGFCLRCAKTWAGARKSCPLCRTPFKRILYNIESDSQYDIMVANEYSGELQIYSLKESLLDEMSNIFETFDRNPPVDFLLYVYCKAIFLKVNDYFHKTNGIPSTKAIFKDEAGRLQELGSMILSVQRECLQEPLRPHRERFVHHLIRNLLSTVEVASLEFYHSVSHIFGRNTYQFMVELFSGLSGYLKEDPSGPSFDDLLSTKHTAKCFRHLIEEDKDTLQEGLDWVERAVQSVWNSSLPPATT